MFDYVVKYGEIRSSFYFLD